MNLQKLIPPLLIAAVLGAFGWLWNMNVSVSLMRAEMESMKSNQRVVMRYCEWLDECASYQRYGGLEPARRPRWDNP